MQWILFNSLIVVLVLLDLFVFHRKSKHLKAMEAFLWSGFWIILALAFNLFIYFSRGGEVALQFFLGYLIEKLLSVDNLFVFVMIFHFFKTPAEEQREILYWGILGAFIMRLLFILGGLSLMERFHWMIYLLGAFLIFTGIKFFFQKEKRRLADTALFFSLIKRIFPKASRFFITLLAIEYTDVIFALDSLPAIFAITKNPFIVYTSNVFAILGLRSLYFVLAAYMKQFRNLKYFLGAILVLVGLKMLFSPFF
jgi:tellurite resistance protein TerC